MWRYPLAERWRRERAVWGEDEVCVEETGACLPSLTLQPDQEASVQTLGAVTVNLVGDLCNSQVGVGFV